MELIYCTVYTVTHCFVSSRPIKNVSGKRCSVDAQAKVILGYFQGPGFRTSNANERVDLAEREGGVE